MKILENALNDCPKYKEEIKKWVTTFINIILKK